MSFYNNISTQAHISGTIGGLMAERVLIVVPISFFEHLATTILTTTISFGLPFLYKWVLKKYFKSNEL